MLKFLLAGLLLSHRVEYGLLSFIHLQNTLSDERETPNAFALRACQNMVNQSQENVFYAIELDSDPTFKQFIQHLQNAFIQTIVISQDSKLTSSVLSYHRKNMIFIVNDVNELLSLIFYSASRQISLELNGEFSTDPVNNQTHEGSLFKSSFSHYCIQVDGQFFWSREDKTCDQTIGLSSAELRDGSILSDPVFNATRSLYTNTIWNSKNHLIFFLKNLRFNFSKSSPKPRQNLRHRESANKTMNNHEIDPFGSMMFCFKFFWRFFKSRKAIICHPQGCEKYDPFKEILISLEGERDEDFFDFSLSNMQRKPMQAHMIYQFMRKPHVVNPATWKKWISFHEIAIENLAISLNCSLKFNEWDDFPEDEDGLRYDISLLLFQCNGITMEGSDISKVDLALSIDTTAICIATPHSAFMSQGLVIFVSFTPVVWILTVITIFMFSFFQYVFQYLQRDFFIKLYSEAERDTFRDTSSMLTVCAYILCGSPPSLTLGRLVTGKMIFTIFSFSALIMSTAFLGSMTTLLSDRVLYPEIDSLAALEESDFDIETLNTLETDINFFVDRLEPLRMKLVMNYLFYQTELFLDALLSYNSRKPGDKQSVSSILSVSTSNAFLVSMPFMSNPRESVIIKQVFQDEALEYHLVKECLMMYPITMPILKNSIFYDKLNQVIAHMLETGHARRILDDTSEDTVMWGNSSAREVNVEPRAYDMSDLQSAFIGLGVGLFLSFLAFVGELSTDLAQSSAPVKFFRRMNIS
ncbi:unnamed protein product [Bemisia tabaci]|uniref:Ionotropic receptor n=1 Tax=Bemisia tabaci TaxID=7038 RepID=A0A9P0APN4_BEMTA|nr:unnamed protein product [Bemisia tabaci]